MGEGSDYTDNLPQQCLHPVGHWYEVPNMLRNGVLAQLLANGRSCVPVGAQHRHAGRGRRSAGVRAMHIASGAAWTAEVITRRIEDRGGGLARVDGRLRLVEGLALPREEVEFNLTYYNSSTTGWTSSNCWRSLA
jgi:hypothetical protein